MRKPRRRLVLLAAVLAAACGGGSATTPSVASATSAAAATGPPESTIVGRWEQVHTCQQLLRALNSVDLLPIAPSVIGYFPDKPPEQIAQKAHVCQGAKPELHSHFFTSNSGFGSLDQNDQQVDEGTYRLIDARTIRIQNPDVDVSFHFRIVGKVLKLYPVITDAMQEEALAHPLDFSAAGWAVAVSYIGQPWHRVPCDRC
jgi:hypothetical protein